MSISAPSAHLFDRSAYGRHHRHPDTRNRTARCAPGADATGAAVPETASRRRQRPYLLVAGDDVAQVGGAAEEASWARSVSRCPPWAAGSISIDRPLGRPEQVAGPQIAVDPGRRLVVGLRGVLGDVTDQSFDRGQVRRAQRAAVHTHAQVRHEPALGEPSRPRPGARRVVQWQRADEPGPRRAEVRRPGAMRTRERRAEGAGGRRRWAALVEPFQREQVRQRGDDLRQRCTSVDSGASEAGRLGLEESVRPVRLVVAVHARPIDGRSRLRPALREDRCAVVEREPGGVADRAAVHGGLADALMRQERRQVLRVRAQVGEVHAAHASRSGSGCRARVRVWVSSIRRVSPGNARPRREPCTAVTASPWPGLNPLFGGAGPVDGGVSSTGWHAAHSAPSDRRCTLAGMDISPAGREDADRRARRGAVSPRVHA